MFVRTRKKRAPVLRALYLRRLKLFQKTILNISSVISAGMCSLLAIIVFLSPLSFFIPSFDPVEQQMSLTEQVIITSLVASFSFLFYKCAKQSLGAHILLILISIALFIWGLKSIIMLIVVLIITLPLLVNFPKFYRRKNEI